MIQLPDEILQRLAMFCEENNLSMATIGSDELGVQAVVMGYRNLTPNFVSLVLAHILINGVITGDFTQDNMQNTLRRQREETERKPS